MSSAPEPFHGLGKMSVSFLLVPLDQPAPPPAVCRCSAPGMVFGIILAAAFFFIPGIGPMLTRGLIGSIPMGTVEDAVVGAAVAGGAAHWPPRSRA